MKVWRVTLSFEPVITIDVVGENVLTVVSDVLMYLKNQGNKVDENIIVQIELISVTEDMKLEPEKPDIIDLINNEKGELL